MVYSIVQSLLSLLWVFLLLLLIVYVFAIVFLNAANDYARRSHWHNVDPVLFEIEDLYGTLSKCILTLFMAISGGADWQDLMRPLAAVHDGYRFIFVAYIFFVVFGVLNVVTGAFVDNFSLVSQRDRDVVIEEEMRREQNYVQDMKHIFEGADKDSSGHLSLEEFETHLQDSRVNAFFNTLELDTSQARMLFILLDIDGTNEVGIDEFVTGCMRLKGDAKSIDVNMLLYQSNYMISKINALADVLRPGGPSPLSEAITSGVAPAAPQPRDNSIRCPRHDDLVHRLI